MKARALIGALATTLAMSCAVEVEDFNRVDVDSTDTDPAPSEEASCAVTDVKLSPTFMQGPVARTQPIAVRYRGYADDVTFTVAADGQTVSGATLVDARAAYFVPNQAWPAGAMVGFHVELCGGDHTGQFEVGAIMERLDSSALMDTYLGTPFAINLARGRWDQPAAQRHQHNHLRELFGGAVLVEVESFTYDGLRVSLTPAVPDGEGAYIPDRRVRQVSTVLRQWSNPYALAEFDPFTMYTPAGPVTVYEPMVLLGFGPSGFVDTRLVGVLDLNKAHGDDLKTPACEELESWAIVTRPEGSLAAYDVTGDAARDVRQLQAAELKRAATCQPCGYTKTETCVDLEVVGLEAVPPPGFKLPEILLDPPLNGGITPEYVHPDNPDGPLY